MSALWKITVSKKVKLNVLQVLYDSVQWGFHIISRAIRNKTMTAIDICYGRNKLLAKMWWRRLLSCGLIMETVSEYEHAGRNVPGRRKSMCKGPGRGISLASLWK